ncbi:MAG: ATP-binding cassette domain-containing protein, partial [Chloroflexi bacterium]
MRGPGQTLRRRGARARRVTLEVPRGAAMALLGQNGAGKSALMKLVIGFPRPSGGRLEVLGEERVERAHGRIAVP